MLPSGNRRRNSTICIPTQEQLIPYASIFYSTHFRPKSQTSFSSAFKHSSLASSTQRQSPKLEESKRRSGLQEEQEGRFRELQAGQPHLNAQEAAEGDPSSLLSIDADASGLLCPVLSCSVQERYGLTGASPVPGHKDD